MLEQLMSLTALPNLHPALVHFPVALLVTALAFDAACLARSSLAWLDRPAALVTVLGAVGSGAAYLSGRQAANGLRGLAGEVEAAVWDHADLALVLVGVFSVIAVLRVVVERRDARHGGVRRGPLRIALFAASIGGQALLAETADRGGALVFRHGVAVKAPAATGQPASVTSP